MKQITHCDSCQKEYQVEESVLGKKAKCSSCGEIFVMKADDQIDKIELAYVDTQEESQDTSFKPHKLSFIFLGSPILTTMVAITIVLLLFVPFFAIILGVIAAILFGLRSIEYKKENYTLTDRKVIYHYGTIFSDNSVEVNLDKVTQVISILGFVQNKIFGTGNVVVKTAGSSASKIVFNNIENSMDMYEEVQKRMKKNGFHLAKDTLVQETKPHFLGVIGEVLKKVGINTIILVLVFGDALSSLDSSGDGNSIILLASVLYLAVIVLIFVFTYHDLKRREYRIYTDAIEYTEGFLTKVYSVLPMESVADTENTQSFLSKILGLHDVKISSQGSSNQVLFKNMIGGEKMMENVKYLKDKITMSEKESTTSQKTQDADSLIGYSDKTEKPLDYDKEFTAEYKMDLMRSIAVFLPFIITIVGIPFVLLAVIAKYIMVRFTRYIVTGSTIEMKFNFLSNKHYTFSVEKITGVAMNENLLDKYMGTCSITFWSIGSSSSITFSNIKKTDELYQKILAKIGVREQESREIPIEFNLANYLKSAIGPTIVFGILMIIYALSILLAGVDDLAAAIMVTIIPLIIFGVIFSCIYIYKKYFYSSRFYKQRIHLDYIESHSGIIFQMTRYVLYRHIKGIKTKKYPLTDAGSIVMNVAGEQVVQTQNKQKISLLSNVVKIAFAKDVFGILDKLDNLLLEEKIDTTLKDSAKQDVGNSIFVLVLFAFVLGIFILGSGEALALVPVIIVFGLIIGWIVWSIKVKYYNFEGSRIIAGSGIIYKRRHSILYERFNFIEKNQGFINKIFKNGIVKIYTLGSGSVEMRLTDVENYQDIYEKLKKD